MDDVLFRVLIDTILYQLKDLTRNERQFEFVNSNEALVKTALQKAGADLQPKNRVKSVKLGSIFNHIHRGQRTMEAVVDKEGLFSGYGEKSNVDINRQISMWEDRFSNIPCEPDYVNAILECFEDCFSVVPASADSAWRDVSLYAETKIAVAIACCLKMNEEKGGAKNKPFTLFSLDFSGIQSFIYTITSSGALRALRVRSMYLSLMTEYVSDLILDGCKLSRANLIYAGGGRAHILLPSVDETISTVEKIVDTVNDFLRQNFGAALYLASGWVQTDGKAFTSDGGNKGTLSELFAETSRKISAKKLRRYSYDQLKEMNSSGFGERECAICGNTGHLVRWKEMDLCITCAQLERFSSVLQDKSDDPAMLCVVKGSTENGLLFPSADGQVCSLIMGSDALSKEAVKTYTVNATIPSIPNSVRIALSRHQARPDADRFATFSDLADHSQGIRRLGVLRGDVDNLGALFARGFVDEKSQKPYSACTLTRYAALSSSLTWFFQKNLDHVLKQNADFKQLLPVEKGNNVSVVYAGGDDVFLIGGWNDVLNAGLRIQKAFEMYTGSSITMSAGYSVFGEHTPVPIMADATADLEETAKSMEGKNTLALFENEENCYHWSYFISNVLQDKLQMLEELFEVLPDKGNSFLYHVLLLLRKMSSQPTAISSLAYLLARHVPIKNNGASDEQIKTYKAFEEKIYRWAIWAAENDPLKKKESEAFQTACQIYVYMHRVRENND